MNLLPQQTFPPRNRRPIFCCYDGPFVVDNKRYKEGVYYHCIKERKDSAGKTIEVLVDLLICSVLKVLYILRTESGIGHAYLIEYIAHGETQPRRAVLPQASLLSRPEEALKELRDLGVSVLGRNAKLVREYLDLEHLKFSSQKNPLDFWTSVKVIGWSPVGERFVLPHQIIGAQNGV
jgi:hypothetical protein